MAKNGVEIFFSFTAINNTVKTSLGSSPLVAASSFKAARTLRHFHAGGLENFLPACLLFSACGDRIDVLQMYTVKLYCIQIFLCECIIMTTKLHSRLIPFVTF